jgi:putative salt-induced outer membrane protein
MIKKIAITSILAASLFGVQNEIVSHAELGYVGTTGNTDTQTFSFDGNAEKKVDKHAFIVKAEAAYAENSGVVSKRKFQTELGYDYKITQKFAFNYVAGYKRDTFTGYKYETYTGPGAKYFAIEEENQNLTLSVNAFYYREMPLESSLEQYSLVKTQGDYSLKVTPTLKFIQELSYSTSFEDMDNYFVDTKTAFTSKISDILSAGVSYKLNYVNLVPAGIHHEDTTFAFNMIIDY